jgi:hypothetical protein
LKMAKWRLKICTILFCYMLFWIVLLDFSLFLTSFISYAYHYFLPIFVHFCVDFINFRLTIVVFCTFQYPNFFFSTCKVPQDLRWQNWVYTCPTRGLCSYDFLCLDRL